MQHTCSWRRPLVSRNVHNGALNAQTNVYIYLTMILINILWGPKQSGLHFKAFLSFKKVELAGTRHDIIMLLLHAQQAAMSSLKQCPWSALSMSDNSYKITKEDCRKRPIGSLKLFYGFYNHWPLCLATLLLGKQPQVVATHLHM